jgi:hypothetical protein
MHFNILLYKFLVVLCFCQMLLYQWLTLTHLFLICSYYAKRSIPLLPREAVQIYFMKFCVAGLSIDPLNYLFSSLMGIFFIQQNWHIIHFNFLFRIIALHKYILLGFKQNFFVFWFLCCVCCDIFLGVLMFCNSAKMLVSIWVLKFKFGHSSIDKYFLHKLVAICVHLKSDKL